MLISFPSSRIEARWILRGLPSLPLARWNNCVSAEFLFCLTNDGRKRHGFGGGSLLWRFGVSLPITILLRLFMHREAGCAAFTGLEDKRYG
jgi:hypothetical protein